MSYNRVVSVLGTGIIFMGLAFAGNLPQADAQAAPDAFVKSVYVTKLAAEKVNGDQGIATTVSRILMYTSPSLLALIKSAYEANEPVD